MGSVRSMRRKLGWVMAAMLPAMLLVPQVRAADAGVAEQLIVQRFPAGTIRTQAEADAALAAVRSERARIREEQQIAERLCYERFFTNMCLENARSRERAAKKQVREVENEANAFKRRMRLAARERRAADKSARQTPVALRNNMAESQAK